MNTRNRMKNIFINFVLVCSMVLSIVGSAFLLKPVLNSSAEDGSVTIGLPNGLKFTASKSTSDATGYNSTNGYEYSGSSLNYISANGLTYYFNSSDGKLYSDPEYKNEAKDIRYSYSFNSKNYYYNPSTGKFYYDVALTTEITETLENVTLPNGEIKISKALEESSYSTFKVYSDVYTFLYKNSRYYFKGGNVYSDAECTTNVNIPYVIQFEITAPDIGDDKTADANLSLTAGTYYSEITAKTLYSVGGYYPVSDTLGAATGFYVKADDYSNLYHESSSGIQTVGLNPSPTFEKIKPYYVYFLDNSLSSESSDSINSYFNVESYDDNNKITTPYYTFENKIYSYPVLKNYVSDAPQTISIDYQSPSTITTYKSDGTTKDSLNYYYPVTIDAYTHYILYSTTPYDEEGNLGSAEIQTETKLYDYVQASGTMVEITQENSSEVVQLLNSSENLSQTILYEYNILSIDRAEAKITISRVDADDDNIDDGYYTPNDNSINVNYYFTSETFSNANTDTCHVVVINGTKYCAVKNDSNNYLYQAQDNGARLNSHGLNIISIDDEKVVVSFDSDEPSNPTKFVRYGAQYLYSGTTKEISGNTYSEFVVENKSYYNLRSGDEGSYTYGTDVYLYNSTTNTMTITTEITLSEANEYGVVVKAKSYYYVRNNLCVKNTNVQTYTINLDTDSYSEPATADGHKYYPMVIMGETYYLKVDKTSNEPSLTLVNGIGSTETTTAVDSKWTLSSIAPIRTGSNEILIKITYSDYPHNDELGDNIYNITTAQDLEINTNLTNYIQGDGYNIYYPITINGLQFYVNVNSSNGDLVNPDTLISSMSGGSISPTAEGTGWKLIGIEKVGNIITVKLNMELNYTVQNNLPKKYDSATLNNCTNFVSYQARYFYHDTKLYLDAGHNDEIQDFTYDSNISQVLINNAYIDIQSADYQYVELFDKIYYFDGIELYSTITLGGENKIIYSDKVIDAQFGYRVNKTANIITIFDTQSTTVSINNTISDSDKATASGTLEEIVIGVVQEEGTNTEYYVTENGNLYLKTAADAGKKVDYRHININYTLNFTDEYCTKLSTTNTLTINGTGMTLKNSSSTSSYYFTTDDNSPWYQIFLNDLSTLYYTTTSSMGNENPTDGMDFAVVSSGLTTQGTTKTSEAYRDFIVNLENNTVLFANSSSTTYHSYSGDTFEYTISGVTKTYTIDDTSLKSSSSGLDATEEIFDYKTPNNLEGSEGKTLTATKFNGTNFEEYQSEIVNQNYSYIQTSGMYYIIGKYGSNNPATYTSITLDYSNVPNTSQYSDNAEIMATSIKFTDQSRNTAIVSSISKDYVVHEKFNDEGKISNGDTVMLNNFVVQQAFFNQSSTSAEKTIENVYIGFNEKLTTDGTPENITQGVTALTVNGYLKNDYVMKYFSTTAGYNTDYGISININSPTREPVKYLGETSENNNYYWYQHLDLSGLKANIDYKDQSGLLTEIITETSGQYTFIFKFTYLESKSAAAVTATIYLYEFSFYLTENSDYIEYPTFNTYLSESNVLVSNPADEKVTRDEYYTVVENTTSSSGSSNITYTYNFQTFDKPVYIFDASKYNVSYDFKYNLENHSYKTSFVIKNAGKSTEYGLFSIYKDTDTTQTPYISYRINTKKLNSGIAIDYYTSETIDSTNPYKDLYGSLYIDASGNYKLSLENYYYYNTGNRSIYGTNELSYYENGRLIKNGAQNTPESYYIALMLNDIGDYTFTNKYLISVGNNGSSDTAYFKTINSDAASVDVLEGVYKLIVDGSEVSGLYLEGQEVARIAYYNGNGEFILPSNYISNAIASDSVYYNADSKSSNPTLKIYGITTTFNKNSSEIPFNKLDENVYSDITPKISFKDTDDTAIDLNDKLITNAYKGTIKFDENYTVPITNLQPIYFRYFGTFDYNNSYYYRYQNCSYVVNDNGTLAEVDFSQSTRTIVGFTNKTSISSSGFYIVVVKYSAEQSSTSSPESQYFMFAIDNSAPNLELYVANETDASDKTLFISSTTFSQTSRYTNKNYIVPSWLEPNYFQGDIVVTYKRQNYGLTSTDAQGTCVNDTPIKTADGRFTFTITYGVNGISSTSTYIIVDQTTPEGKLYSSIEDVNLNYFINEEYNYNVFNSPIAFASTPYKTDSGALVTARMTTISLQSYTDYGNIVSVNSQNAITTNVQLDATSSSFYDTLDESPIYNFFDISNAVKNESIKKSQLLGFADESTIYIIKLYDEAGNYSVYYYIYDNSTPYLKYQLLEKENTTEYVDSFEDNTTNTNTSIVWNNYKAIYVKTDAVSRELFDNLQSQIENNSTNYGQISFNYSNGDLYLFVPIKQASLTSKIMVDGISETYTATTSTPNFSPSSTVFIDTATDESMNGYNSTTYFKISQNLSNLEFFRGNRDYQIKVTDSIGNTLSKKLWVNGSFAQEKFEGILENSSTAYRLSEDTAYNIAQITTTYKALTDQSFYAQISFDYYGIDFENYLTTDSEESDSEESDGHISYSTFGYDLQNSVIYMYDSETYRFVERGEKLADGSYAYAYNSDDPDKFYTYDALNKDVANGKFYVPGYPYVLTDSNSVVSTTETTKNGTAYKESGTILEENQKSKQGLYVFRRVYIDNITSQEITQNDILTNDAYSVLENDRAVRYYVYYVDRNNIIDLTYDANGNIDAIESIGNLLEIFLGTDIDGNKDPVIDAETLNSGSTSLNVKTNKLKVETNFTADKYATANKLINMRNYTCETGTINQIGEDLSIKRNANTFNYSVDLTIETSNIGTRKVIVESTVVETDLAKAISSVLSNGSGTTTLKNYQFVTSGTYTITISDNTFVSNNDTGEKVANSANSLVFKFGISHDSPSGGFITLLDGGISVKELSTRDDSQSLTSEGLNITYSSSNVDNLSFTFSDSESEYDATVNPYNVIIQKGTYTTSGVTNVSTLFQTTKATNLSNDYWSTFASSKINANENSLVYANPQNPNLTDILIIYDCDGNNILASGKDNGAPYTYRINIFDKEKKTLLADYSQDAVYIATINYIGTGSDYVVGQSNYYKTTFTIHIDRVAPKENLNKLISSDPNLDEYCISKYGLGYSLLTSAQKQEIIETYAFPVNYITEENVAYYYAKDNYGAEYEKTGDLRTQARTEVLNNHSTFYNYDHDDSERIYARSVGNVVTDYKYSILPNQEGYNDVGQHQDHQRFTQSSTAYNKFEYVDGKFYFSDNIPVEGAANSGFKFDNAYYEIIEEDEAGNLTRYLVYATDNTDVNVDYRYITSDDDNVDKNYDGITDTSALIKYNDTDYSITDRKYFIYNNIRYYAIIFPSADGSESVGKVGTISNNSFTEYNTIDGEDVTFDYAYYYHNNTIEKVISQVYVGSVAVDLVGSQFVNIDYTNNDPLEVLNISGIHFLTLGSADAEDTYLFDDFFTVKIYQGTYSQSSAPAATFVSNPYAENFSIDSFMKSVTTGFKKLIAEFAGVYEYTITITNRFSKNNPYVISFNLPDQTLELNFTETVNNTLTVTLPNSSSYVKILEFKVYKYEDKQWKQLTTDSKGVVIQTMNIADPSAGLTSTSYTFTEGQYKFITKDNYNRINGDGNGEYKIVGGNYDENYAFSYNQPYIINENGQIITSGYASLNIDDTIYQVTVILKNAVKVIENDGTIHYYALICDGSTTKMYRYIDGINDKLIYINSEGALTEEYVSGCKEIYYNRGKLYSSVDYQSVISLDISKYSDYTVYPNTSNQYLYSLGARIDNKRNYTLMTICENSIAEYQVRINWATDPSNYAWTNIKFDRNAPKVTLLLNEGGVISAVENQNYNKPFTISWTSDYNTTATLVRTIDSQSTIISLTPGESYEISIIAGYTLTIIDEIGNKYTFNFNYVKNANEYFSVLVDEYEILPSDYVVPDTSTGKTIRYYYYKINSNKDNIVSIKTDETKNIAYVSAPEGITAYDYTIIRTNIGDYVICYVKVIGVSETIDIKNYLDSVVFTSKSGEVEQFSTSATDQTFVYEYNKGQDCESFTLNVNKNLLGKDGINMIGNKVYVKHFYNEKLIRTYSSDSWSKINYSKGKLEDYIFKIPLSSTGVHRFEFSDSVGNKASQSVEITLIKDIMFTANEENPIDYRFYNTDVVIDVPSTSYYSDVTVTAKLNGVEINTAEFKKGTKYTFSQAGTYEVYMTAESINENYESTGTYSSVYYFTIINPNVAKMTFGFSNNYGFTISKVLKNQSNITELIKSESVDSMWLTSGNPDSVGTYTITLLGYDKLSNTYLPFTFVVKLNNEIPTIMGVDYSFGTKTTKNITVQYNAAVIYSQVGESYIRIIGDNGTDEIYEINAESADELTTLIFSNDGKYRVTIYNQDGIFIASYAVHKAAPLNTSAKIIIIIAVTLVVGLTVVFIVLRRHTKFR